MAVSFQKRLSPWLPLALVALSGCDPKVITYRVSLITSSCTDTQPLHGVQTLRFRVTGEGLSQPLEVDAPLSSGEAQLPDIPAGRHRVIEVRGYAGEPGGAVLAVGRSLPFDVPDALTAEEREVAVNIFIRKTNAFTRPSGSGSTCEQMTVARAGHTATLLADGKVFIAGGFQLNETALPDGGVAYQPTMLNSTELFDPTLNTFVEAEPMRAFSGDGVFTPLPRAFHTATLLKSGQVLIAGGEERTGSTTFAIAGALVYDYPPTPDHHAYGTLQLGAGRSRHAAVHDADAGVLLVGGVATDGGVVSSVEWFDPSRGRMHPVTAPLPRQGMSVAAVQGGKYLAVAGGTDGESLKDDVVFFSFDSEAWTFAQEPVRLRLNRARRGAAITGIADGTRLLLVGGYASANENAGAQPMNTSELVSTSDSRVLEGPVMGAPRGDVCAALLQDGRVLAVGGRAGEPGGQARSDDSVELIGLGADGRATAKSMERVSPGRFFHTCTPLKDGSVLVLGGVNQAPSGSEAVLQDAWIFTPAPLDP